MHPQYFIDLSEKERKQKMYFQKCWRSQFKILSTDLHTSRFIFLMLSLIATSRCSWKPLIVFCCCCSQYRRALQSFTGLCLPLLQMCMCCFFVFFLNNLFSELLTLWHVTADRFVILCFISMHGRSLDLFVSIGWKPTFAFKGLGKVCQAVSHTLKLTHTQKQAHTH